MSARIEDYALIGDCETAALVARDGSIDWLCLPRFDSAACFAALLGTPENGRWRVAPRDPACRVHRRYRDDTLILETAFETSQGAATLVDFMPPRDGTSDLVRLVSGIRGRVDFCVELTIRFDYGGTVPWVSRIEAGGGLQAVAGPDMLVLRTPVPLAAHRRRASRGGLPQRIRSRTRQFRSILRGAAAGCGAPSVPACPLSSGDRPARARHGGGDRAAARAQRQQSEQREKRPRNAPAHDYSPNGHPDRIHACGARSAFLDRQHQPIATGRHVEGVNHETPATGAPASRCRRFR